MRREGVPEKESIFVSSLNKIDEAYTWLKEKLKSLFKLFSKPITEATQELCSFVTSCYEKSGQVLSWINAQMVEAYTWMKPKLGQVVESFIKAIMIAMVWILSYIDPSYDPEGEFSGSNPCHVPEGEFSGNNTKMDNSSDNKLVIRGMILEDSIPALMETLVKTAKRVASIPEVESLLSLKANKVCAVVESVKELFETMVSA